MLRLTSRRTLLPTSGLYDVACEVWRAARAALPGLRSLLCHDSKRKRA